MKELRIQGVLDELGNGDPVSNLPVSVNKASKPTEKDGQWRQKIEAKDLSNTIVCVVDLDGNIPLIRSTMIIIKRAWVDEKDGKKVLLVEEFEKATISEPEEFVASGMKAVDIKGKAYIMVTERIKYFREHHTHWSLTSEIVSHQEGIVVFKATITDENDVVRATGHACEKDGSTFINKTSYVENCETSAWGRALGNLGIGIDASMASADEVANAIKQQKG